MEDWSGDPAHRQVDSAIRCEWGMQGAEAVTVGADVAVVVDVLSFTTTLSLALDAGMTVLPYRWKGDDAETYARDHDAMLAVSRDAQRPGTISLSPGSIRRARDVSGKRLVLPSPNGSAISVHLASRVPIVLGASLRNASAVAAWIADQFAANETIVAVIPAGERWADGSLRPAVEDCWGAGAVLSGLREAGWQGFSPEAEVAADAFASVRPHLAERLRTCASGRELIARGYGEDVEIAAELDVSAAVPWLRGNAYVNATE
jgi:2-phosphosulfolactate phosphatase